MPGDQLQFFVEARFRLWPVWLAVAAAQLVATYPGEDIVRRLIRRRGVAGKEVGQIAGEIECGAAFGEHQGVADGLRVGGEAGGHFLWRAEGELRVWQALAVAAIQRRAVADGDQHVLQAVALPAVVVDVAGGDGAQTGICRETGKRGDAARIAEDEVVLQLDGDVVCAEPLDVTIEQRTGLHPALVVDQPGECAAAATGEQDQPLGVVGEQAPDRAEVAAPRPVSRPRGVG